VHLLDRQLELAGCQLVVEPLRLLRRQQAFPSLEALTLQIQRDAEMARKDCLAWRDGTSR
jgi:FAD synthase